MGEVLILGCHDLTMFNPRARANAQGWRQHTWKSFEVIAKDRKPVNDGPDRKRSFHVSERITPIGGRTLGFLAPLLSGIVSENDAAAAQSEVLYERQGRSSASRVCSVCTKPLVSSGLRSGPSET